MGSTWLITGGSGFLGHALTRRLLADPSVAAIRCLSRSESAQAKLLASLTTEERKRVRCILGDVRDAERVRRACRGATHVIHAAALKRVESVQADVREAVLTNVVGSLNVAEAALEAGCESAVLVSSDKAAGEVVNAYGYSKAMAEQIFSSAHRAWGATSTRLGIVRYGNVIGSTGSVFEAFRSLMAAGKAITVSDPQATRFFWPVEHACELAVWAARNLESGHMAVPVMMRAASMGDVAKAAEELGATVTVTGHLHDAERLHETLLTEEEMARSGAPLEHIMLSVPGAPLLCVNVIPPVTGVAKKAPASACAFAVTSDGASTYSVDELKRLLTGGVAPVESEAAVEVATCS